MKNGAEIFRNTRYERIFPERERYKVEKVKQSRDIRWLNQRLTVVLRRKLVTCLSLKYPLNG